MDVMTGGAGNDRFIYQFRLNEVDVITDFTLGAGSDEPLYMAFLPGVNTMSASGIIIDMRSPEEV